MKIYICEYAASYSLPLRCHMYYKSMKFVCIYIIVSPKNSLNVKMKHFKKRLSCELE